jgi:hypothetical protein
VLLAARGALHQLSLLQCKLVVALDRCLSDLVCGFVGFPDS